MGKLTQKLSIYLKSELFLKFSCKLELIRLAVDPFFLRTVIQMFMWEYISSNVS